MSTQPQQQRLRTKVTDILGIEHPIIMGGMHYVGYAELAAAVSNAGGLGMITALTQPSPEMLAKEIEKCQKLTNKPFGVNLTLLPSLAPPDYGAYIRVIIASGVKIVETAGRSPDQVIPHFKKAGIIVIHKCVTVKHGLTAHRLGADILSMDGFECGGHPGENDLGNWILAPLAAKKLSIPFIISGGCANGQQLAGALALGAQGMNLGTRLIATKESIVHDKIKQALVDGNEYSTTLVLRSLKNTERVYKNITADKVAQLEASQPGNLQAVLPYIKGENYRRSFHETGDTTSSVWSCGQSIALIDDIPSVSDLINTIVDDALKALNTAHNYIVSNEPIRATL